jgi:hypothetical protein
MNELLKLLLAGLASIITLIVAVRKKDPGCPT